MHDLIVSSSGDSNRKKDTYQKSFPEYVFDFDLGIDSLDRVWIDQSRLALSHRQYGDAVPVRLDFYSEAPVRVGHDHDQLRTVWVTEVRIFSDHALAYTMVPLHTTGILSQESMLPPVC